MVIDKAANNVAIIYERLYALVIAKELGFSSGNSNDKNGTYDKINSIMENEHKEYLSNHYGINLRAKLRHCL